MKRLTLIAILGMLLITFITPPLLAGEVDILIEKLVEKGILTQSEAKELLGETQKEATKEKEEIKEVAKEVAKKEVASKPFELPKGLKGVSIGGTYFFEYFSQDYDEDSSAQSTEDFNSFRVQRAYITLKKKFAPWFKTRFTADITYDSARKSLAEIGWEFRLKYAYGEFDFKDLGGHPIRMTSEVGLVHTFSDAYDAVLWPYRSQGKHFLDRHSIMSSADFGVNARFRFGGSTSKEFKKKVSKKLDAKWGALYGGAYNGSGYTKNEDNDNKVFEVAGYIRPFNMTKVLEGFLIGGQVMRGESDEFKSGNSGWDWEVNQIMASYQHEYFTIMAQYYDGKGEDHSTDEDGREGYNIAAFVRMPFHLKLRVFGRYDFYDDNEVVGEEEKTKIFGLSYDLTKGVMPWVAIEDVEWDGVNRDDYTMYQAGLMINF